MAERLKSLRINAWHLDGKSVILAPRERSVFGRNIPEQVASPAAERLRGTSQGLRGTRGWLKAAAAQCMDRAGS